MCLYKMGEAEKELKSTDVAKQMNQPLQKTIQALQRMHYQKYIVYSPYQPLKITDQGKEMAQYLIARGQLIEEFLDFLQVHTNKETEKEAMEQYLSYETLKSIEKFILLSRKYPEISERYTLLLKKNIKHQLLPTLPENERL